MPATKQEIVPALRTAVAAADDLDEPCLRRADATEI